MSSAQFRVYSLVHRNLAPPLAPECVSALLRAIHVDHVELRDGAWSLTPKGRAEFLFAREVG